MTGTKLLLIVTAVLVVGLLAYLVRPGHAEGEAPAKRPPRDDAAAEALGWRLGTQAYTFRAVSLLETIEIAHGLGLKYLEVYPGQKLSKSGTARFDHNADQEARAIVKKALADAGMKAVCYGVVGLGKDEAANRAVFEFARDMGIENIVSEPGPDALDVVAKLADEFAINVAFHNHPKPSRYWDADTVLEAAKGRTARMGACADTGHWARSGLNPVECLRKLEGRIISLHFKDLDELNVRGARDVPWGTGKCDAKAMLHEIARQGFKGVFSIEYETSSGQQLIDNAAACIAFFDETAREILARQKAQP